MRTISNIHTAAYAPIADLVTYSPLPSRTLSQIDPFLFLNHHGPQVYKPNNNGLPFGPHPHRGMETVTFILEGDIMHKDSGGHESVITAGGVQWMTAGSGLIHAETSSEEFKRTGGPLEILQLWLNLPARLKMTEPRYTGLQKEAIPVAETDEGRVKINAVSGDWEGTKGAFKTLTDCALATVYFTTGGRYTFNPPAAHSVFLYAIRGAVSVNGTQVKERQLAELTLGEGELTIEALSDSILLLGHAEPLNEPVVAQGPFVMNTEQEIRQAYNDYRQGKFGTWI